MHSLRAGVLLLSLALASCGGGSDTPAEPVQTDDEATSAATNTLAAGTTKKSDASAAEQSTPKLAAADRARVCRAAVADANGHSPSIVKLVSDDGEIVRVRYNRPDDGKQWINECRFEGDRVLWRTVDAFGSGSGTGRWRDTPADESLTFALKGGDVTISTKYSDGSGGSETYKVR